MPKTKTFPSATLNQQIGFHLRLAQLNVFSDLIEALKALELRPVDLAALSLINDTPDLRQHTIGDYLKIARPNVVALIDTMQKRGLTERITDEKDRRANHIRLTALGQQVLAEAKVIQSEHRQLLVGILTEANVDIENFMAGLNILGACHVRQA